ncbi:unnamed protein product (macronuclear) [Paramecium tetraurelia]|uniref:B box-type domain-containing protein n=1 Tax=Paramecium tetraurelia TaxID=5888 RepID=A0D200_PARTE|nr:uncharacterized protein GSPATT00012573001 [Paramecium tetraurelia]CAK77067.1 unnamed protein product [Paramecium tetraurelia]|eukprot:XP_001444464.1 hypothetical protein (macronuclear) [Paramecium tetraurelia strain d4-2]
MQQIEELICPECQMMFNEYDNLPLMLPDCGHTICQILYCVQKMGKLIIYKSIMAKNKSDISQFPKNCQLLKMVIKHKAQYQQSRQSARNDDSDIGYQLQLNNLISNDIPNDLCQEHLEKLEIVCFTDQVRICTRCALFGQHRHHEVRSVDDVVKEITQKAENIMQIYQKILQKQCELTESKYFEPLQERFSIVLAESHNTVKEKFKELHQLLDLKEQRLIEQLTTLTQSLEQQTKKQIKELLQSSLSQAELWKITAKDRLVYFSTKTENGELPLDLLNNQDYACVDKGKGIQEELEKIQKQLDLKLQNIKIKKLRVDLKKTEIDKSFDNLFTITLQLSRVNNPTNMTKSSQILKTSNSLTDSTLLQDIKRNESFSKLCGQDVFSSFCQDEPMLLKDIFMADWSESLMEETTNITQVRSPNRSSLEQEDFVKNKMGSGLKELKEIQPVSVSQNIQSTTPTKPERIQIRALEKLKGSFQQPSPGRRDIEQVNSIRQGISPNTKIQDCKRKKSLRSMRNLKVSGSHLKMIIQKQLISQVQTWEMKGYNLLVIFSEYRRELNNLNW